MSGQVSKVLEGMDKLNAKVESFMQQLLACREDGVNVRNPKTVVATINIKEVDVNARIGSPEILGVAKSLHEVVHSLHKTIASPTLYCTSMPIKNLHSIE